jgi:hypothetical protein
MPSGLALGFYNQENRKTGMEINTFSVRHGSPGKGLFSFIFRVFRVFRGQKPIKPLSLLCNILSFLL